MIKYIGFQKSVLQSLSDVNLCSHIKGHGGKKNLSGILQQAVDSETNCCRRLTQMALSKGSMAAGGNGQLVKMRSLAVTSTSLSLHSTILKTF